MDEKPSTIVKKDTTEPPSMPKQKIRRPFGWKICSIRLFLFYFKDCSCLCFMDHTCVCCRSSNRWVSEGPSAGNKGQE